jgi:hypothetical protein
MRMRGNAELLRMIEQDPNLVQHGVYRCAMRSISTLLCCIPLALSAQHCGYDFRSVIVVRPHAVGDSAVIDGLRITLLDSNNLPVVHYEKPRHLFHRNVEQHLRPRKDGYDNKPDYFPFAQDSYVLVVPNGFRTARMKVLVQDERDTGHLNKRRDQWPVRFKQVVVPLTAFDSYPLCGVFDEAVYPPMHDRSAFHPVDIILYPR